MNFKNSIQDVIPSNVEGSLSKAIPPLASLGRNDKTKVYQYITSFILWGTLILVLAWLFAQDFVPSGTLILTQDFKQKQLYFDDFRPGERLIPFLHEGDRVYHRLISSPIYFHIRTPRPFERITFVIDYRTAQKTDLQFGGQNGVSLSDFAYESVPIIPDNQWHTANISFDLSKLRYHPTELRYQFSFQITSSVDIGALIARFEKKPLF